VRGSVRTPQRQSLPRRHWRPCQPLTLTERGTDSGLGAQSAPDHQEIGLTRSTAKIALDWHSLERR